MKAGAAAKPAGASVATSRPSRSEAPIAWSLMTTRVTAPDSTCFRNSEKGMSAAAGARVPRNRAMAATRKRTAATEPMMTGLRASQWRGNTVTPWPEGRPARGRDLRRQTTRRARSRS